MAVYHSNEDAWRGNVLDAVTTATAAERAKRLGWLVPGRNGDLYAPLTWSDPLGLTSSHSLDTATGIMELVAEPGVATAFISEWAGWEGRLYGQIDLGDFFTNTMGLVGLLVRDTSLSHPASTDLCFGLYFMNGPRTTATYAFGGGWRHNGVANQFRPEARNIRASVHASAGSTTDQTIGGLIIQTEARNNWTTACRTYITAGAGVGGSINLGAYVANGTCPTQAAWGNETYFFFGVGRLNGSGVAPNDTSITVRALPHILVSAPDWSWAGI